MTGFVGPNGAGKSTTMRLILGLDAPDAGDALIGGRPYARSARPLREVGALLDAAGLHPGRRARDHLLLAGAQQRAAGRRVDEVLGVVGLAGGRAAARAAGSRSACASGSGIAAALLGDPAVLLLDEPVNGLDPEGIRWIRGFLRGLAAEGRTVFVSSHLMSELEGTADHLIVIRPRPARRRRAGGRDPGGGGRRARRGAHAAPRPADDAARRRRRNRVESSGDDRLAVTGLAAERIADLAAADGIPLYELTPARASLEDVFMEMTR